MSINDKNVIYGGPIEDKYGMENCTSVANFLLKRLKEMGNHIVLIDASSGEKLTAIQLRLRSIQLAMALEANGLKQGDIISVYSENRFEFVYLLFACIYLGISLGITYIDYTDEEFENTVAILRPKMIFTSHTVVDKIIKLAKFYNVRNVIVFGNKIENETTESYNSFVNQSNMEHSNNFISQKIDIEKTVAIIIRTSGTTSSAKSVQMTQKNVLCAMWEYNKSAITPNPLVLSCLPWVRPFGLRLLLRQLVHNTTMIFLPYFMEKNYLKAIETYRPTTLNLYVTTLEFLANSQLVDQYDLTSVKVLFSCSSAQDSRIKAAIHKRLAIPIIQQGYGMSEFGSITDQNDNYQKIGSVGQLRHGVYGKVIDLKSKENLGPNQRGHLMFYGPNIMKGYVNNDAATKNAIDCNGWLCTGDYGYYNENYEWFLIDRIKDLIKYKNEIIPPNEIETIFKEHVAVEHVAVIGIPDNKYGELPVAYIVCRDKYITENQLLNFINGKVIPDHRIHFVRFIKDIPADSAGKPSKLLLRQLFNAGNTKF